MPATDGFCDDCFSAVGHEGSPTGKYEEIGGWNSYTATPEGDFPADKVVIFLPDVFGLALQNNPLIIDGFARNGLRCVCPDIFEGDARPVDADPATFDREAWHKKHNFEHTGGIARDVIQALKAQGVTRFGLTGYCYGARLVFDLAFEDIGQVAVVTHPSALDFADLDRYAAESKAPLLINSCEKDPPFPAEKQAKADEVLKDFAPGYKRAYFAGVTHGFAVKGDISDPMVKAAKEDAFKNAVDWFKKYL
ncbi:alpha/beta-hydrolase [Peniophora sp. CONT]|nr:alpha/beta-hydrolase [Peniophora sp. CONT]